MSDKIIIFEIKIDTITNNNKDFKIQSVLYRQ